MKPLIFAFLVMTPSLCLAEDRIDPKTISLSPIMEVLVSRGVNQAGETLWVHFEKFSKQNSGVIVFSEMNAVLDLNTAKARASKVYGYLSVDLNWDGQVTRSELETVFTGDEQGFVDGYLLDGDLNKDGVITLAEMMADAKDEHPDTNAPSNGYLREMLTWDLNGDQRLEFNEVIEVLVAQQDK